MDILMNLIKRKQDEVSQPKPKKYMRRGEKEALSKVVGKDDADSDEDEQPETGTTDTRTASERRRDDTMKQREKEEDEKERTAQKKARDIKEAAAASNMVQRAEPEPEKVYAPMATSIYGQADGDAGAPVFDRPSSICLRLSCAVANQRESRPCAAATASLDQFCSRERVGNCMGDSVRTAAQATPADHALRRVRR